jgi:hypothetical protein
MFPEIITILVGKRKESALKVQEVLTEFGCIIVTRIGFHETVDACNDCGLIILQVKGEKKDVNLMVKKLNKIKQVKAKTLELSFDD